MINIPTTQQIYNNIIADLEAQYNITIPLIGKSFLRAYASVLAAQLKLNYLLIGKVQKNIFIDTADPQSQGGTLERFGFVKLGRYPFKATQGIYEIEATGTPGQTIPAGTTFKSDDNSLNPGLLFILDTPYTMASPFTFNVRALTAGLDSQLQLLDTLTVTAPLPNIESQFVVTNEVTTPQAPEGIEEYRRKALDAYRLEPQGGAGADYRLWASDAQGVKQSYPYASVGGGSNQVSLYIEANINDSTDGKGTPTAQILTNVEESIEDPTADRPSRKPITDTVDYLAVNPLDVEITINSSSFTTAQQTLIDNSIEEFLDDVRPFVSSIDILANKNDIFDTNKIIAIILDAVPGSSFGAIDLVVDGNSVSTFTFQNGDIPFLDSVTYA